MSTNSAFGLGLIITGIMLLLLAGVYAFADAAYKAGQTDAINGKIVYILVKQPDGTTKWEHTK